jgi:hypothetical protein
MADAFLGFVAHPLPVSTDIFSQAGGAGPRVGELISRNIRGYWGVSGELRWDFDQRLVDEHGNGIQV